MVYVAVCLGLAALAGLYLLAYSLCVISARCSRLEEWMDPKGSEDDDL